jgi:hypothetical protein
MTLRFPDQETRDAAFRVSTLAAMSPKGYRDLIALCANPGHSISGMRREQLERRKLLVNGEVPQPVRSAVRQFESRAA